jgi:hypothetical protein
VPLAERTKPLYPPTIELEVTSYVPAITPEELIAVGMVSTVEPGASNSVIVPPLDRTNPW